jgi:hypothetical protein
MVIRNTAKKAVLMITAVIIQRESVINEPAFLIIVLNGHIRAQVYPLPFLAPFLTTAPSCKRKRFLNLIRHNLSAGFWHPHREEI